MKGSHRKSLIPLGFARYINASAPAISEPVRITHPTKVMARTTDPNSATSQFYICDGAQTFLDDQYAAFGLVLDGMKVVRSIASVETTTKNGMQDWPFEDVIINNILIENQ